MFIGRETELNLLKTTINQNQQAVMIYGKRKVGKTTLIQKALEHISGKSFYFECLKSSLKDNLNLFSVELYRQKILPAKINFDSWTDAFDFLNSLPEHLVVVIDEYPYLKNSKTEAEVDAIFQNIIDNRLGNMALILSGSHIGMMKSLLAEGNALYGRFTQVIHLKELDYQTCSEFYPDKSVYDRIGFYSVFGGSPYICSQLDPTRSLKDNIIQGILNQNSMIYHYADNLLLSDYTNRVNASRIFSAIGNGRERYKEIQNKLNIENNGSLSKQLKMLTDMEIIQRNNPINRQDDPKKTTYEINDNLMRFYYSFVERNKSTLQIIGPENFYEQYVSPALTTFIAHRFEEICRDWFGLLARKGAIPGIRRIGSYYYDDAENHRNGEFDIALETADGITLVEAKYLQNPLPISEQHKEIAQVHQIKGLNINKIGFIAVNGFEEKIPGCFYATGEDLYETATI